VNHKKHATLFWTTTPVFIGAYYITLFCANGNRKEYNSLI